jgi:MoaA/NifB/PqqE/SkfB family radical SAM enzyme
MTNALTDIIGRLRRFAISWQAPTLYPPKQAPFYPEDLILFVTERCNMRCKHCMFINRVSAPGPELETATIAKMAASCPPLRSWNLTGGEPTLHPDIEGIVRAIDAENKPQKIQINTNGLRTEQVVSLAERLSADLSSMLVFQVSIDGIGETHDEIRNMPGCFARVDATLRALKKLERERPGKLQVASLTVINERNYKELDAIADYLYRDVGVVHIFDLARGSSFSAWKVPEHLAVQENPPTYGLPPIEELPSIYKKVRDINRLEGYIMDYHVSSLKDQAEMYRTHKPTWPCITAGTTFAVVYSDGSVTACEFTKPFASIYDFDNDLLQLWNSPQAEDRRSEIKCCHCTHVCFLTTSMEKNRKARLRLLRDL